VLLGVAQRDPGDAPSDPPRRVLPFCKAGGGLTDEIMRQLREQLLPRGRRYAHERPPALFGDWRPEPGDRPHLWFEPCESILVELRVRRRGAAARRRGGC
jgi:ATP-dependent DNA ligase